MAMRALRLAGILAVAGVVLSALALMWRLSGEQEPPATVTAGSDAALLWRVGQSQQYAVDIESSFLMAMPGSGSGQAMTLQMDGVLDFLTLNVDSAGADTGMCFDSISLVIDGASDAAVNRALATPFRVRFDHSGRPLAFDFPATLAQEHRDILENTVRMFQAIVARGDAWEAEESNSNGRYRATYARVSPTRISKSKSIYLPSVTGAAVPEVESDETIKTDPANDWITGMSIQEHIAINDPGSVPVQVSNLATLKLLSMNVHVAAGKWNFAHAPEPDAMVDPRANLPQLSPAEAQRRLAADVQALEVAQETRSLIIHRVRDLLLADDQLPAQLIETLRTEELSDRTRADLYLAFELAGTPASQAALASVLIDGSWPPMDAMRAIVALGGVSKPTHDTMATLWGLARTNMAGTDRRDLPGTAALALGSIGNGMRESEVADYAGLRADLLVSASSAVEPQQRAVFLYALANTADPDPVLKRDLITYLDDPSVEVRSAAAKTLGRLGTNTIENELIERVRQEPSALARASMIKALESWDEPSAEAMRWAQGAAMREPDETTRHNLVVLLGNNMDSFPENRRVLEALLESEQSKRIRQELADLLY